MGFGLIELIILLVAVAGSGVMMAILTWIYLRIKDLPSGTHFDGALLTEEIQRLREDFGLLQSEVTGLAERVDFTEKLLNPGGGDEAGDELDNTEGQ